MVMFDCVRNLLDKTKTKAEDVDFLVVNCSLFSPTPSLCTMIINEFGMRSDISSYNLSGMGCSAGLISIELVKNLLASRPNSVAVVVSHENLTQALYEGNDRPFLLQNTLFRCGEFSTLQSPPPCFINFRNAHSRWCCYSFVQQMAGWSPILFQITARCSNSVCE